jgi:hypothetical protein
VAKDRFPHEQSPWSNDNEQRRRWYETLERMSPVDVRALLAQSKAGSPGSVSVGGVSMTRGFVEEWRLAWHDRQKAGNDLRRARWTIGVTVIVAVVGWLIALLK